MSGLERATTSLHYTAFANQIIFPIDKGIRLLNEKQYKQPLLSELSRRNKLRLFRSLLRPGEKVLEVGAGSGWFAEQLRSSGYQVTTIDLDGTADVVGDITLWRELGMTRHRYDAVVGWEVIEHVDCLAAMMELCKPDGYIFLSSPHPAWDWMMKILEVVGLTQKRTSPHCNLTDFAKIALPVVVRKRPAFIHQLAVFRNNVYAQDKATK